VLRIQGLAIVMRTRQDIVAIKVIPGDIRRVSLLGVHENEFRFQLRLCQFYDLGGKQFPAGGCRSGSSASRNGSRC
jgi:hypothetical protein